ncbi:Calcium-dependent lipid-binding family protein [Perilla frutescens var. hirtella]|uniref:Calcium-dependent lipid-binding family protein n=1 Tax=Perilla frutescens var. hirtella TaxID=608512 RepID=A0AAD4J4Y9_PERFH|nr:Calcium-dependent lipid-binding family protein [Perilla frutescens var. hirtella]
MLFDPGGCQSDVLTIEVALVYIFIQLKDLKVFTVVCVISQLVEETPRILVVALFTEPKLRIDYTMKIVSGSYIPRIFVWSQSFDVAAESMEKRSCIFDVIDKGVRQDKRLGIVKLSLSKLEVEKFELRLLSSLDMPVITNKKDGETVVMLLFSREQPSEDDIHYIVNGVETMSEAKSRYNVHLLFYMCLGIMVMFPPLQQPMKIVCEKYELISWLLIYFKKENLSFILALYRPEFELSKPFPVTKCLGTAATETIPDNVQLQGAQLQAWVQWAEGLPDQMPTEEALISGGNEAYVNHHLEDKVVFHGEWNDTTGPAHMYEERPK